MLSYKPEQRNRRLLLTSVCRPLGPKYGDGESVGYELLYGQVTRAQGMFSPRATHVHYALDYIANNLEIPTVVLHYPSRRELIRELKRGYDFVGNTRAVDSAIKRLRAKLRASSSDVDMIESVRGIGYRLKK